MVSKSCIQSSLKLQKIFSQILKAFEASVSLSYRISRELPLWWLIYINGGNALEFSAVFQEDRMCISARQNEHNNVSLKLEEGLHAYLLLGKNQGLSL